ncbi:MAG: sensor histidine kinase [Terriglobia bacterium]
MIALALGVAAIPVHLRLRAMAERDQAQRALEEGRTQLEARVQERTRDLRASEHSLRQRPLQLMRSQDEERRRLARELHDGVCQYLCYAKFVLQSWIRESQASGRELEVISQATDSLDECLDETRSLSHLLHPPLLDELDLVSATRRYVDGFCRRSPIRVNFTCPNEMGRLSSPVELVLFRIIQESLTNVLRHARSPNVDIELQDQGNQISLTVRDFGKGMETGFIERFNSFGEGAGVGLSGMRERLAELHGKLTVEPCEPGTLIRATLPLEITDSAD